MNFSHIPRINGNSRISRRSIDLFTGEDPARSINHKTLSFTGKCNESQFYCSKPKKFSSSEEGSSSISTVDRRRCHLLHVCHGCCRKHLSRECHLFRQGYWWWNISWISVIAHAKTLSLWVCCAYKPQAKYRPYSR